MDTKIYLLIFFGVFTFFALFLRTYILKKNTGLSPMTFDGSNKAQDLNGSIFRIVAVVEFIAILIFCFGGDWYQYLLPFWYLENWNIQLVGWILLHISLVWVVVAQLQMKDNWRIGIDFQNDTSLVTDGLFTISRNPIFLGMIIANLGMFLVVPNAFILLVTVLSTFAVNSQVRMEEDFLVKTHGQPYLDYQKKVRRWI